MSNTRKDLEDAAFWDGAVCLNCDTIHDPKPDDSICPDCGEAAVYTCAHVLRCADAVEEVS